MKSEIDLSKMKSRRNPCASKLKKPVTMLRSDDVVECFKSMATEASVPTQPSKPFEPRSSAWQDKRCCSFQSKLVPNKEH